MGIRRYLKNVLIGLDQFIWTLLGGAPDETISAAMWRLEQDGHVMAYRVRTLIDYIALKVFEEADHCQTACTNEFLRRQLPDEYLGQ